MKPAALQTLLAEQDIYFAEDSGMKWPVLMQVPVLMKVKIPLPGISLRELTVLRVGEVIVSDWPASEEVPLYASNVALSWGEFEVVDGAIAVRLTRLG
jgi:flagellar motor switch/type III secretory pathway protein FliN